MDSAKKAQDASAPVEAEVTFERYAHDFIARREIPMAEALRAHIGLNRSDVASVTFARSFLDAKLAELTGAN